MERQTASAHATPYAQHYARGEQIASHAHAEAQLAYCISGVMQVTGSVGRWLVPPARAVWIPPRAVHSIDVLADIEMRTLYFAPELIVHHAERQKLDREFVVRVSAFLRDIILAHFEPDQHVARRCALTELVLFDLPEAAEPAAFLPLPTDPRARRVADLVLKDPGSQASLADLAQAAGTSMRTVSRLFALEIGQSFREWRARARIAAAVELVGRGDLGLKAVASRLGFSSVSAFSFAFRQIVGCAPTEFTQQTRTERRSALPYHETR